MSTPTCDAVAPVPLPSGRICAWCYPNTVHPLGSGVCPDHQRELLLDMHLEHSAQGNESLSPKK